MPRPPQAQMVLTPKDIVSVLRRHIFLIIFLTFTGVIAGGVSWYLLLRYLPKYRASTYIKVLPDVEKDPMKITSAIVNKDIQYGKRQEIAALIKQQSTFEELLKRQKIKDTKWYQSFGTAQDEMRRIKDALDDLKKNLGASAHRDAGFVTVSMTCGDAQEAADIVNEMVDM